MTSSIAISDVEQLRSLVSDRIGLHFDESKTDMLREVFEQRLNATGMRADVYLKEIDTHAINGEVGVLAQALTVPETYFFRNIQQFHALTKRVLPELVKHEAPRTLRVLSAGCASGEEAYSLAIMLREHLDPRWQTSITAVDINTAVLDKARRGKYSNWSLRETPSDLQAKWLVRKGNEVTVDASIAAAVTFEQRNLAADDPTLWAPESFDVVFCRNVLMYFSADALRAVIAHLTQVSKPGGYLFLGHAETLRGLSKDFHLCHTDDTFYYRRKFANETADTTPPLWKAASSDVAPHPSLPVAIIEDDGSWYEAIQRANEHVHQLTESKLRATSSTNVNTALPWSLDLPMAMLQRERFSEALELVEEMPTMAHNDIDVLLLRAALLTHGGRLTEAEETCRTLLAIDDLRADAHHVLALCREGSGDLRSAVEQNQTAIYLDAAFAMPHLHLALLARRTEDATTARHEFNLAATLLERESTSRILLFGGGFGRDALIALSRSETPTRKARS